MKTENYIKELLFIFFRQQRVIVWVTGITLLAALLVAFFWPPTYAATGNILVRGKKMEKSPQAIENEEIRAPGVSKEDLSSEEKILVSPNVIEQTIKWLIARKEYPAVTGQALVNAVYRVQGDLKTELVPASNVIEVSYRSRNARMAVTLLGALMENYIGYRTRVYNPVEAGEYFTDNAERYRQKLSAKENELLGLVRNTSVSDTKTELSNNLSVKYNLQLQLNLLQNEAIDKRSLVQHLDKMLAAGTTPLFSFIENVPAIAELSKKLQGLLVERGAVLKAYNAESDMAKLVTKHFNDTYETLRKEVQNYKDNENAKLQSIQEKIASIGERTAAIDRANVKIKEQYIAEQGIERDIAVYQSSFDAFSKRREESVAAKETNMPSQVSIVKRAFPSDGPVFPRKPLVILFGLLVGFINGFTLGFLIEYFDHTFKKPSDVERYTGLPVIASIQNRQRV